MQGGCACGHVRYELKSTPIWTNCCHCTWCQRESGSAFALNAMIEADNIVLTAAAPEPVHTPSASGKGQDIRRCPKCQVALWSHYSGSGLAIAFLRVGTIDHPHDVSPDVHIFTTTKRPWVQLPEGVPSAPEYFNPKELWPAGTMARFKAAREAHARKANT
jgi:hypothetical protein